MVTLEYKLKGNEFKTLQYLKVLDKPKSQLDMSKDLNMSIRTVRNCLQSLKYFNVIVGEKVKNREVVNPMGDYPTTYTVNNISLWELDKPSKREVEVMIDKLVKEENERHKREDFEQE